MAQQNPYEEQAFKAMSSEARDWHIMDMIAKLEGCHTVTTDRIAKLERRKKKDTTIAGTMGLISGAVTQMLGKVFTV